jgi:hypothetical protein
MSSILIAGASDVVGRKDVNKAIADDRVARVVALCRRSIRN